ncbi:MAG: DUF58 domain-containing protein, partial [Burkholderiales bacterium]
PRADSGDSVNAGAGNDDFASLRGYQTSDSPKHIAWKAVARSDTMLTKSFMGRSSRELIFDWQEMPTTLDLEARLSRLTRWVLLAKESGIHCALHLPGAAVAMGGGEKHYQQCLEALALYEPGQR